jgi:hypothetical protein
MQWEVWAIPTSNLIAAEATENRALAIVRDLLAADWTPDELTLIVVGDRRSAVSHYRRRACRSHRDA